MIYFSFKILETFLCFCFYYLLSETRNKPYANLARCNWFLLHAGQLAALNAFLFISDRFPNLQTVIVAFASRGSIVNIPAPQYLAFHSQAFLQLDVAYRAHKLLRAIDRSANIRANYSRDERSIHRKKSIHERKDCWSIESTARQYFVRIHILRVGQAIAVVK